MTTAQAQPTDHAGMESTEREKFYADLNRTRAESEKFYAEMRKLNSESSRSFDETMKMRAEKDKAEAEAMKMRAEKDKAEADTRKLVVDTMKVQLEVRWFPYAVIGSMVFAWFAAGAALLTALIKLFALWGQMLGA